MNRRKKLRKINALHHEIYILDLGMENLTETLTGDDRDILLCLDSGMPLMEIRNMTMKTIKKIEKKGKSGYKIEFLDRLKVLKDLLECVRRKASLLEEIEELEQEESEKEKTNSQAPAQIANTEQRQLTAKELKAQKRKEEKKQKRREKRMLELEKAWAAQGKPKQEQEATEDLFPELAHLKTKKS